MQKLFKAAKTKKEKGKRENKLPLSGYNGHN